MIVFIDVPTLYPIFRVAKYNNLSYYPAIVFTCLRGAFRMNVNHERKYGGYGGGWCS